MEESMKNVYAEVFEILSYMDRKIILKTPIEIIEFIKKNREEGYISRIDKNDIFNKNNIEKKTLSILAWLNINYWAEAEKKKELIKQYRDNDIKYELELREQYIEKELFVKKQIEENSKNTSIAKINEENIFKRIISKIKQFFKKYI